MPDPADMHRTTARFAPGVTALEDLIAFGEDLCLNVVPREELQDEHRFLIAAIYPRTLATAAAAAALLRAGHGPQAMMLTRSMFEDMVDMHWIETFPDEARERWGQHHRYSQLLLRDAMLQHPDDFEEAIPDLGETEEERKELAKLFGRHGERSWTSLSLYERTRLIEGHWSTEEDRSALRFYRRFAHRDANSELHLSTMGLNDAVRRSEAGLHVTVGPTDRLAEQAIVAAWWCLGCSTRLFVSLFAPDHHGQLEEVVRRGAAQIKGPPSKLPGRNEPCWCGSDAKYKRCHGA